MHIRTTNKGDKMLETFTISTFSKHKGERFLIYTDSGDTLEAELTEVNAIGSGTPPPDKRQPFSLVFNSQGETILPQKIYNIEHDGIGIFDLFLVPIHKDEQGVQYEAVFT
jgi:hypothetical protein